MKPGIETVLDSTLVNRVMRTIQERIEGRILGPGARLPSIRKLAASMDVSISTVVEAYNRLVSEGTIRSRPGSGFYIAGSAQQSLPAETERRPNYAVDPLWISRLSLDASSDILQPGCGVLPSSWIPDAGIRRALRTIARSDNNEFADFAPPLGLHPLRQILSRRLAEYGIAANADQIMLTDSNMHAIDLICRFVLEPGDTVIVDDPCFFNFLALCRTHRAKVISVPYTPSGPDLECFAAVLAEHHPRLYITNSAMHDPTGAVRSPVITHKLLKLADLYDLIIIEDDIFADFMDEPAPHLAGFDGLERVFHTGGFSISLSACAQCGFIAARRDWLDRLVDMHIATTYSGGKLTSQVALLLLADGTYRKHMEHLRTRLARSMGETRERLKSIGITPWIEPQGGMYLWCQLPGGVDAVKVAQAGFEEGVIYAPGNVFSQAASAREFMRFNVAQCANPRIFEVLERSIEIAARSVPERD